MTGIVAKLNPGFSAADADQPRLVFDENVLVVVFREWTEDQIEVRFPECYAVCWQSASTRGSDERDDEVYEIRGSDWLALHREQEVIGRGEGQRHFRLCFNAWGQLDVLAQAMEVVRKRGEGCG